MLPGQQGVWTQCRVPVVQVTCITLGICIATWLSVFGLLMAFAPSLPMTAGLPSGQSAAIISLAATLMMARSPASMVSLAGHFKSLIEQGVTPIPGFAFCHWAQFLH